MLWLRMLKRFIARSHTTVFVVGVSARGGGSKRTLGEVFRCVIHISVLLLVCAADRFVRASCRTMRIPVVNENADLRGKNEGQQAKKTS